MAGVTVGLLFAPQNGLKTRKKISKIFSDYKDDAKDYLAEQANTVETKAKNEESNTAIVRQIIIAYLFTFKIQSNQIF